MVFWRYIYLIKSLLMEFLVESAKRVRQVVKWSSGSRARRKDGVMVLDGVHVVREALEKLGEDRLVSLFVTDDGLAQHEISQIVDGLDPSRCAIVRDNVMGKMAATVTPQGVLGVFRRPESRDFQGGGFVLVLENIQDPTNVGAMIRSGAALGVETVLLSKDCADVWSPRAIRASQGAHFYTQIVTDVDLESVAKEFSGHVVGTVLSDDTISLYDADLTGSAMIVMGNEGVGITHELQERCSEKILIPMQGKFESLNVAHASAIVCAEKSRQDLM